MGTYPAIKTEQWNRLNDAFRNIGIAKWMNHTRRMRLELESPFNIRPYAAREEVSIGNSV